MITRRDALRFAATLPIVGPALAASATNVDAALDLPLDVPEKTSGTSIYDPVEFAESMNSHALGYLKDSTGHMAPEAYAAMNQAFADLYHAVPCIATTANGQHCFDLAQEAALSFAVEVEWSGLRAGAAYEYLRLALLTPMRTCPDCFADPKTMATCGTFSGRGVVPTPGVAIAR
jgi:hypothetical protein